MITPMRVFVLIFNPGTVNEGIHTVRIGDRNKVLMFELEDDATRFALMLEAQDFPTPIPEPMDAEEIKEFCKSANYDWEIVPENSDLILPPEVNVEDTDWKPESKESQSQEEFSDSELDRIRRKLEGLL